MYEKITFTNGISDYFYSSDLHKLHFICDTYNLNFYDYKQFNKAFFTLKENL